MKKIVSDSTRYVMGVGSLVQHVWSCEVRYFAQMLNIVPVPVPGPEAPTSAADSTESVPGRTRVSRE
jgi:hypothetical protein